MLEDSPTGSFATSSSAWTCMSASITRRSRLRSSSCRAMSSVRPRSALTRHSLLHAARAYTLQPLAHQHAIVEIKWHDVGDRAERHEIEQVTEIRFHPD